MAEPVPCMILDDDELEAASKTVNWRKGNSFEVRSLFRAPAKFPFQRFPKIAGGGPQRTIAWPTYKPLMEVDWVPTPEEIAESGVPLLPMPELFIPIVEESVYDEDGDPRYAACTPPLRACASAEIEFHHLEESAMQTRTTDDISISRSSRQEEARQRLRVCEEETAAPAIDPKDVVGFSPDIYDVSGNLCQNIRAAEGLEFQG